MSESNLAVKYINDHTNPIKRAEQFGCKLFLTQLDEAQQECKDKCLMGIEKILRHSRVDRKIARSVAEWIPGEKLAKVIKVTGVLRGFGFHSKNTKFLKAEECLVLMELNKLELLCNGVQMSLEETFKLVDNIKRYFVYRKLILFGFKLKSVHLEAQNSGIEGPPNKIMKLEEDEIFASLRQNGPQNFDNHPNTVPDYSVKKDGKEMNLKIVDTENFDSTKINQDVNFFGFVEEDNVSFYMFHDTQIPNL